MHLFYRLNASLILIALTMVFVAGKASSEGLKEVGRISKPQIAPSVVIQKQDLKQIGKMPQDSMPVPFNHNVALPALEMHMLNADQSNTNGAGAQNVVIPAENNPNIAQEPQSGNEALLRDRGAKKSRTCMAGEHLDASSNCVKNEVVNNDQKRTSLEQVKNEKAKVRCQQNEHLDANGNCVQ